MQRFGVLVKGACGVLDKLAGICIFLVMLLVVTNVISRGVFNNPILGTYELVGFLTAMAISFALAHCAWQDGHIALSFVMDRFPRRIQSLTAVLIQAVSIVFWSTTAWYLIRFAQAMKIKGLVSPSAEIPVYPFIYLVALGLAGLCLVLLCQFIFSLSKIIADYSLSKLSPESQILDIARKAAR